MTNVHMYVHRYLLYIPLYVTSPPRADRNFLYTFLERADHPYLNSQYLACEMWTGMCEILTKSGLSFMYKMIREIISMPRADSGYPHNFMVNSWVFKDEESESDAKTNSRHRVCLLLVEYLLLTWRVHAQRSLLAHCVNTYLHIYILHMYLCVHVGSTRCDKYVHRVHTYIRAIY